MQIRTILAAAAAVLLSYSAYAESDALQAIRVSAATIDTNRPGVRTYAAPPEGFDPARASDAQLAFYGFPPRPEAGSDVAYSVFWTRTVQAGKVRWTGELSTLAGGGARGTGAAVPTEPASSGQKKISTDNASGVIITNGLKTWNKKKSFVLASVEFTVPKAQLPFGVTSCAATDYTQLMFTGIDGVVADSGSGDEFHSMLQGGVYADVPCGGTPFYYAEFEWEQNGITGVFPVNPGDVVNVSIQAHPDTSTVFVEDLTTQVYGTYSVSTPGIVGSSANWIVERLCCTGNQLYPLADTINVAFGLSEAQTGAQLYSPSFEFPGTKTSSTQILTMTEGGNAMEFVEQLGASVLWFDTLGCAYSGGCPAP